MPWLVQHHFDIAREHQGRSDTEAFVLRIASDSDTLAAQVCHGGDDVVAHERQLLANAACVGWPLRRMDSELCRWKSEDKPAVPGVDVVEAKGVAEDRAQRVGFGGVEERVSADDGHVPILQAGTRRRLS
jgi:hypothetical protein